MSDETMTAEDGQEPSMEDILTSIRTILSEEEEAELASKGEEGSETVPGVESESQVDQQSAHQPVSEVSPIIDQEHESKTESGPEPEQLASQASIASPELEANPEPVVKPEVIDLDSHDPTPSPPRPAPMPPAMEAMLELTPDMIASKIVSEPTHRASTDVLSELAAKILDRRDLAVDTSSKDMTLEGIVREMLKPILREWLDRNLPYLIERLVKREIDLMVNRAERLED